MNNLNRRDFLKLAGKVSLGAAAVSAIPAVAAAEAEAPAAVYPWPYPEGGLDVKEVQDSIYATFFTKGGCCAGVAAGIMDLLAAKYGAPYNQIDGRMFAHGGGGYGRRNLCGSLGGAFAVLNLFTTGGDMSGIRTKIYEWYESTNLPIYQPADKPEHAVHTVAGSELCRDSVGNWMAASGFEFGSAERKARCAALSAEVAVKVVELLNIKYGFEAAPVVEEPADEPALAANEYIGEADGFGGKIKVKVTMDGDKIAKIDVLENSETEAVFGTAYPAVTDAIVAANSVEVDTVANATFSSNGLINAVKDALSKIK